MNTNNFNEFGLISIIISREEIEKFDTVDVLNTLESIKNNGKENENKLVLLVHGYDNDHRALSSIPEVRTYIQFLDKAFPYWFYFAKRDVPTNASTLLIIAMCSIELHEIHSIETPGMRQVEFEGKDLVEFMNIHFHYLNELVDLYNLPEEDNIRISKEIISIFTSMGVKEQPDPLV